MALTVAAGLALAIGLRVGRGASSAAGAPPDLRIVWRDPPGHRALRGRPGETVELTYALVNAGAGPAYVAFVEAGTALGALREPLRLEPGPAAGETVERRLTLTLAPAMREVCLEARLQTLRASDPQETDLADNRACRAIELVGDTVGKETR